MIKSQQYYLDTFKVTVPEMEKIVGIIQERGSNYADLFFENTAYRDLLLKDGEVSSGGFHVDYGVGVRALKGDKTGYAYSENTDMASLVNAAKAASSIAQGVRINATTLSLIDKPTKAYPGAPNPLADRYPMIRDWRDCPTSEFLPILQKLKELIEGKDTRIIKVMAILSTQVSDLLMFNSSYELKYETRPLATLAASVVYKSDDHVLSTHVSRSFRMGVEMFSDALLEEIASAAVKDIDDKFAAKRPKGGQMPVVLGAGASGILLHEAMGHAFEADFNRKGQSIFADKMGQKVCDSCINVVDDGTIRGNRGALNFDDEGVPAQRTYMIREGILTSYLHDRISARYYDVAPTGNGRRESFRYNPIPRMRATYMESADTDPKDIIASVKKGIYVDEFTNGQVKIGEGDFTFYVKSGYLIENGHLTQPINDVNIIGNGPKALADIVAVGNDNKVDDSGWTCGKEQYVPVSCGMPTVLVKNLTVGGN